MTPFIIIFQIVVEVTFSTDTNTFFEEDTLSSIGIDINNPIAKDLEVFVFGGIIFMMNISLIVH